MTAKQSRHKYQMVKDYITLRLDNGEWPEDHHVPSENALVRDLGVSRMTVNRAIRELVMDGKLRRVKGLGTFVTRQDARSELLKLNNIADEIARRGGHHKIELLNLEQQYARKETARSLFIPAGSLVYYSRMRHLENEHVIQLEERYVNPAMAPAYLEQDFNKITPNKYLTQVAPVGEVEHIVEAICASEMIAGELDISVGAACLLLHRRTWSNQRVVSRARLYHPGESYRLGANFIPPGTND